MAKLGLDAFSGSFLSHRIIVLQIKKKYRLNPSHCDILILISGLTPGSSLVSSPLLKRYSTGKTAYYVYQWVNDLLTRGFIYDTGKRVQACNYRLTEPGQSIVDYIHSSLRERVKYTNDKMKIAEGLKRNRSKEQTKRKTAAARLRREQARLAKLNQHPLLDPDSQTSTPI